MFYVLLPNRILECCDSHHKFMWRWIYFVASQKSNQFLSRSSNQLPSSVSGTQQGCHAFTSLWRESSSLQVLFIMQFLSIIQIWMRSRSWVSHCYALRSRSPSCPTAMPWGAEVLCVPLLCREEQKFWVSHCYAVRSRSPVCPTAMPWGAEVLYVPLLCREEKMGVEWGWADSFVCAIFFCTRSLIMQINYYYYYNYCYWKLCAMQGGRERLASIQSEDCCPTIRTQWN